MEVSNFKRKEQLDFDVPEGVQIFAGENLISKKEILIKAIDTKVFQEGKYSTKQLKIISENSKSFSSSHLAKTLHEWSHDGIFYQAYERCEPDLMAFIQNQYQPLSPEEIQQGIQSACTIYEHDAILILKQILCGLQDMYELGYVHRNLSCSSVHFVQTDVANRERYKDPILQNILFKITDFTNMTDELDFDKFTSTTNTRAVKAKSLKNGNDFSLNEDLLQFGSPQVLELGLQGKQTEYTSKCDVFSLGVIFYHLLFNQNPFDPTSQIEQQMNQDQFVDFKIAMIQNGVKFPHLKPITNLTRDFLQKTLAYKEEDRLSLVECFKHELFRPFFTELYESLRISQLNQSKLQTKSAQVIQKLRHYVEKNKKNLEELFKVVDSDGNGYLDEDEFHQMLIKIDDSLQKVESDSLFRKLDKNKTKEITIKEFMQIFINQKIPKRVTQKIEMLRNSIEETGYSCKKAFQEQNMGNGFISYMEFNTLVKKFLGDFETADINQLFSVFSENKGMISQAQFLKKISVNYSQQTDFLLEDDIKEQALKEMNHLREVFKEQNVDVMKLFYDNLSEQSDFVHHNEIHYVLEDKTGISKKKVKNMYLYFEYLHNHNKKINWQQLAKALYPRGSKAKLQAMDLISRLRKRILSKRAFIDYDKKFYDKEYIAGLFGEEADDEEIDILFDYFDIDKDGLISQIEIKCHVQGVDEKTKQRAQKDLQNLKKYIKRNEINVDKMLGKFNSKLFSLEQFREIFYNLNEEEATFLYQYIDGDNNGRVTYDEIKEVLTEVDPRKIEMAEELIKKLKYTLEKRKIDVKSLLEVNNIGPNPGQEQYINGTVLQDMFYNILTAKQIGLLSEVYGESRTGGIFYVDVMKRLTNDKIYNVEQTNIKDAAMDILNKLNQQLKDSNRKFKDMFKLFDTEGEGYLTYRSLQELFRVNKIELSEKQCGQICDFLDENGDNEISYAEIARYLETNDGQKEGEEQLKRFSKIIKNYDVNLQQILSSFDTYGDNKLTLRQFQNCDLFKEFTQFNPQQILAMFEHIAQGGRTMDYRQFVRAVI